MATKAQLEQMLADMQAKLAQVSPAPAATAPVVASLAIPDAVRSALVAATVGGVDSDGATSTMLQGIVAFAEAVPQFTGKPIPDADAAAMAIEASKALYKSAERKYGMEVAKMPEDLKKKVLDSVSQKKSRLEKLYRCATFVNEARAKFGWDRGVTETIKLCTEIQDSKYDLAKVFADRKAKAEAPKDLEAEATKHLNAILGMKGDAPFLTAKAKAQIVELCDLLNLKPKNAGEYRNRQLLN